jgi:dTDP-glucose 4,6-dehydratase
LRHLLANTDFTVACPVTYDHKGHLRRLHSAMEGHDPARVTVVSQNLAQPFSTAALDAFGSPDFVVNYASQSHVDRSIADPGPFVANNTQLMIRLLEYARTLPGLRAFAHMSSDEVFGPCYDGQPFGEDSQHRPSNPYAASKSAQSQLGFAWWRTYGVPFVEVYGCNMYGEYQDSEKFVPMVVAKVLAGERVPVHASPDGAPGTRFWQHARNVADAILYILRNVAPARYGDGITVPSRFNITSGDQVSNLDMAQTIASALGRPLLYDLADYHSARPGHDLAYGIDGTRLHELGWKPPVSFTEGVWRLVQWEQRHTP